MDKAAVLNSISEKIANCRRCNLWKETTHSVPGEGNPSSKVVFIGEGPGYNEDKLGRPFVGRAGKLLDKVLLSIGILREDVFITNIIKHRPPENRDPESGEITACKIWLDQQLEVIKPKVIITLGRYSLERYIPKAKITALHGRPTLVKSQVVIPMYHPAAALRSTVILESFKQDFQRNSEILKYPEKVKTDELKEEDSDQISLF